MDTLLRILPLLIPVLIVDSALAAAAVAHHFGNKTLWLIIATVLLLFGPIFYFMFGKGENE